MNKLKTITVKSRVQLITYESDDGSLGKQYANSPKRISKEESSDLLTDRGITFKEVFTVKYENVELEIPLEQFETYIQN